MNRITCFPLMSDYLWIREVLVHTCNTGGEWGSEKLGGGCFLWTKERFDYFQTLKGGANFCHASLANNFNKCDTKVVFMKNN